MPAAALIKDGQIAAAVEEAKLTRRPQPGRLPEAAVAACLRIARLEPADVDYVALARPLPPGSALPIALRMFPKARVVSIDHHAAHAAAAYFASPFEQRRRDYARSRRRPALRREMARGRQQAHPRRRNPLSRFDRRTLRARHRTARVSVARADEHRVQWLSATGEPRYPMCSRHRADTPSIVVFRSAQRRGGFGVQFFESWARSTATEPQQRADIAASMQKTLEDYVMRLAGDAENVCLGGGVAWNALLVSALENSGRFKGVFAQPAAGNAGTALGAALQRLARSARQDRRGSMAAATASGPSFTAQEIKQVLENCKLRFRLLADRAGADRRRRRSAEARTASSRGCRAAWNSGRARSATAVFSPRRRIRTPPKISTRSSSTANRRANSPLPCRPNWRRNISKPGRTRGISPPSAACARSTKSNSAARFWPTI